MDDLLNEFLTESSENLAVLDAEIVRLERNPDDKDSISSIFRLVHTIKGTCGFLGLARLEAVAHAGENVLGKFRDGKLPVTPVAVTAILQCIDSIRGILSQLEETGSEPEGDDTWLIERLNALADGKQPEAAPVTADTPAAQTTSEPPAVGASTGPVDAAADALPFDESGGYPVAIELLREVNAAKASGVVAASDDVIQREMVAERAGEGARDVGREQPAPATADRPAAIADMVPGAQQLDGQIKESSVAKQSIRVAVDTLESLMTTVSELVLTRNQLLQMVRQRDDDEFTAPLQRLSHITSELQEGVMKTRMQPIGNAWAKLPRIVRDLAIDTGKKLDLIMKGAETELDRQVLELIKDPLTHMVRNSADHGIEAPADRKAAGKSETGAITLNAYHEGGHIIIEIKDDGRGLDKEKIRRKAISLGLATEAELNAMSDQQIYHFVFKPAFSTAAKVTNVSGRGVGMDVVRTNIERIGGTIELASVPNVGSTFTIKIPLTLAIVSALIVACEGQRFAIPQICVDELVRIAETSEVQIEMINGTPLLRLRDRLLPLIELKSLFGISPQSTAIAENAASVGAGAKQAGCFVIVTRVGQSHFGIIVDAVFDTEEIVVKPVAPILQGIRYYAGNTILGDGGVVMILDPNGIAAEIGHQSGQVIDRTTETYASSETLKRLLVFRAGGTDYKAIPLELLARLERFDLGKVEVSQGRHMIQYRGHLMPLVGCGEMDDWHTGASSRPTLVFTDRNHSMGLVVDEIVDIVEDQLTIEVTSEREGLVGSAIVEGRATDIIDVGYYLTMAFPDWFSSTTSFCEISSKTERNLLLIDDSVFFRNLITPILSASGFRVRAVESASQALALRDNGHHFDAIVSDIEMPGMNGFDLAQAIRESGAWRDTPLIALSSFASEADLQRGREAGFTDYVAKFDRDGLIHSLAQTLGCYVTQAGNAAATARAAETRRPGAVAAVAQGAH